MKMGNWINRLFRRKKKDDVYFALQVQALMEEYKEISNIRNTKLLDVNQRLTQSLCDMETVCFQGADVQQSEFARRHYYLAVQLTELMQLREEIRNIHLRMETIIKEK